jgi:hypothetical protein
MPITGVELSGSRAKVHSPEHRPGAGSDAWKWHLSARLDRPLLGGQAYAMAEWARTDEAQGFFVFKSVLAEGSFEVHHHRPYYRFERTDRPEDLRELDLFRSVRPHLENSILGITRFTLHTIGYGYDFGLAQERFRIHPFVEATLGNAHNVGGGILTPEILYGTTKVRSLSTGVRLMWQMAGHRMGRYGDLLQNHAGSMAGEHEHRM